MLETILNADVGILLWIQENIRCGVLTPIMTFITHLGDSGIIWIITAMIMMISPKTRKAGIIILISLAVSFVINNIMLKNILARVRPFDAFDSIVPLITKPTDYSFPSGHTAASFAAAVVIIIRMNKKAGIAAMVMAVLIAFSRLYLGVHYPSDVLAGVLSGSVIAVGTAYIAESAEVLLRKKAEIK